jgi:sulfur-oxidizing protein SoxY
MPTPGARGGAMTRRGFLGLASCAAGALVFRRALAAAGGDALAADHVPRVRVPTLTRNGAKVPIVVESSHPMTPEHHVRRVEILNPRDPIPWKGTFHLSPANGAVYLALQARMDEGVADLRVIAECNLHGAHEARAQVVVPEEGGGCTGTAPPDAGRAGGPDVSPPALRIPELVARGRIARGELVHPQLKLRHPSRTGLALRDGAFVQEGEPFHVETVEIFYGSDRVCRFELSPATSDDPFLGFALRARRDAPLRAVVVNSRGQRLEATHEIHLS